MGHEQDLVNRLRDGLIRLVLGAVLAVLCYRFFAPFIGLMAWGLILAVTLYPAQQLIARRVGGRQGLAATLLVVLGLLLVVAPASVLVGSLGDSASKSIKNFEAGSLVIPAPIDSVANWPIVGDKLHSVWSQAHDDLPSLLKSVAPQIAGVAKSGLGIAAGIGGGVLLLLAALVVAAIIMAYGEAGERGSQAIFARLFGPARGAKFVKLSVATIRAVALGVLGVAIVQAIVIGLCLLVAGVPWAGVLAMIVLVLGIVQVPALVVTLPAIAWIWWTGDYGTGEAVAYSVLLVVGGMSDNVLKPLLLGRGVEAPMPVILIGALGGMADSGILGMFVGATLLALGYRVFMGWVEAEAEEEAPERKEAA